MSVPHTYAVDHGVVVPESELSPEARAILEKMSRVACMIDRYRDPPARRAQGETVITEAVAA